MKEQPVNLNRADKSGFRLCLPGMGWLGLFLFLPLAILLGASFLSRGAYGGFSTPFTLESYKRLVGIGLLGFDPTFPRILARSVLMAGATTMLCALVAYPVALTISKLSPSRRNGALLLIVIPFWTNLLVRTYAWQILLSPGGLISWITTHLRLTGPEDALYPSTIAVALCMVCDFLPFMVLPIYASFEHLDWSLPEAVVDLGGGRWSVFRYGIFPQIKSGLVAGSLLVFLPATGQFVIPDLLGGAKTVMLGNAMQQQFGPSRDWPFGAAITLVSLLLLIPGLWLYSKATKSEAATP